MWPRILKQLAKRSRPIVRRMCERERETECVVCVSVWDMYLSWLWQRLMDSRGTTRRTHRKRNGANGCGQ